jgi:hypothetical protein
MANCGVGGYRACRSNLQHNGIQTVLLLNFYVKLTQYRIVYPRKLTQYRIVYPRKLTQYRIVYPRKLTQYRIMYPLCRGSRTRTLD